MGRESTNKLRELANDLEKSPPSIAPSKSPAGIALKILGLLPPEHRIFVVLAVVASVAAYVMRELWLH